MKDASGRLASRNFQAVGIDSKSDSLLIFCCRKFIKKNFGFIKTDEVDKYKEFFREGVEVSIKYRGQKLLVRPVVTYFVVSFEVGRNQEKLGDTHQFGSEMCKR